MTYSTLTNLLETQKQLTYLITGLLQKVLKDRRNEQPNEERYRARYVGKGAQFPCPLRGHHSLCIPTCSPSRKAL